MAEITEQSTGFIIHTIALHSDQQTKCSLVLLNKNCYKVCLDLLYDDILFIDLNKPLKSISQLQSKINFKYSPTKTVISTSKSLSKFFKVINSRRFNYDNSIKLVNLIKKVCLLNVKYSKISYFTKLSYEREPVYDLEFFKHYQVNCDKSCTTRIKPLSISGLTRMLFELSDSCISLDLPSFFYVKVSKMIDQYSSEEAINNSMRKVSNIASDRFRFESCYYLLLQNIKSLTISFCDINTLTKVLKHCDPSCLKHLILTHLTCLKENRNDIHQSKMLNGILRSDQINERFNEIDKFFQLEKTYEIFNNLSSLELVLHNGVNRILFKKFFFSIYNFIIVKNRQKYNSNYTNRAKLSLESFKISETLNNLNNIRQPNSNNIYNFGHLLKSDLNDHSSIIVIPDLLNLAETFTLFDLIDFTRLNAFSIKAQCFFENLNPEIFQELYLTPFWFNIIKARGKKNRRFTKNLSILVEPYDRVHNEHLIIKYSNASTLKPKQPKTFRINRGLSTTRATLNTL